MSLRISSRNWLSDYVHQVFCSDVGLYVSRTSRDNASSRRLVSSRLPIPRLAYPSHFTIAICSSNYVVSFCQDSLHRVSATANMSREILGRILSTWVTGLAGAGLTWLTGFVDSPKFPTSTDTSGGGPDLACVCRCHCESGGIVIACLCLAWCTSGRRSSLRGRSGDSSQGLA